MGNKNTQQPNVGKSHQFIFARLPMFSQQPNKHERERGKKIVTIFSRKVGERGVQGIDKNGGRRKCDGIRNES